MEAGHASMPADVGVEWLNSKGSWAFYLAVLVFARALVAAVLTIWPGGDPTLAWSIVNIGHSLVTFFAFHWVKGNPFPTFFSMTSPEVDKYTWWEQIDHRWQNTPSRKFCRVVVVVLYLLALDSSPWDLVKLQFANLIAFTVAFVAKFPAMDGVRIFGINK